MNFQDVQQRLVLLVEQCHTYIRPEQYDELMPMVKAGEPGVALEILATQLQDYEVAVPGSIVDEFRALGEAMNLDPSYWTSLKRLSE